MSGWAECSHCGTRSIARGTEPAAGRYCMATDCQRGEPIPPDRGRHATCSEECAREGLRSVWREYQRRQAASIPGYYQQRHAVARERLHADPDALERERARERSRDANRRELEAHGERVRERAREWRATDPEAHAAYLASQAEYRRRAALAALGSIATQLESRLEDPR